MENTEKLLEELLRLSAEKEIPYTQAQLKKMKVEKLVDVMEQYRLKEMDKMNEDLVDIALVKFEQVMKKVSLIKQDSELTKNFQDRKLLRKDLKNVISSITPLLPYVGLLEGIVVCTGEIYEKMSEKNSTNDDDSNKNNSRDGDPSSEATEGDKYDKTETESSGD